MNGRFILYLISICIIFLISRCKTSNEILDGLSAQGAIYYNSFESEQDTAGIKYFSGRITSEDASPGGGKRSLYVSGGCIVPHVVFPIPAQNEDCYYKLKCWGRSVILGGSVELSTIIPSSLAPVIVHISDFTWQFYQTEDSLFCPANRSMILTINSGGDNPGGMLVDQIQIVKAD